MAFYIKPPSGIEKFQNLSVFGKKRLTFLKQVLRCDSIGEFGELLECADTVDDSECLIEGTTKDRVSHFFLRLACCQDLELASFYVKAETELFCYRFSSMNSTELIRLLKSTHRFLSRLRPSSRSSCRDLLKTLQGMRAGGLTWEDIISKYLDGSRSEYIQVPFEYVLSLVARRCVVLERGVARVPTADILKVLAFLFEQIISDGMEDARLAVRDVVSEDERMIDLLGEIRRLYYSGSRIAGSDYTMECEPIATDHINKIAICFPPCMQHLHRMLRKKHRLRHFSRVQYTLFLKEVGLPVSHAVRFWQQEYSQPSCCHGNTQGCTHDWQHDGRRYTYSIRHLYGLEGSRVNYRAHSCHSLQEQSMGHGEEGGCPFSHFDDLHLSATMSHAGITSATDQKQIMDVARHGHPQDACQAFFKKSVAFNLEHLLKSAADIEVTDGSSENEHVQSSLRKRSKLDENYVDTSNDDEKDLGPGQDSISDERIHMNPLNNMSNPSDENPPLCHTLPESTLSHSIVAAQNLAFSNDHSMTRHHAGTGSSNTLSVKPVSSNAAEPISNEHLTRYQSGNSDMPLGNLVRSKLERSISNEHPKGQTSGSSGTPPKRHVGSNREELVAVEHANSHLGGSSYRLSGSPVRSKMGEPLSTEQPTRHHTCSSSTLPERPIRSNLEEPIDDPRPSWHRTSSPTARSGNPVSSTKEKHISNEHPTLQNNSSSNIINPVLLNLEEPTFIEQPSRYHTDILSAHPKISDTINLDDPVSNEHFTRHHTVSSGCKRPSKMGHISQTVAVLRDVQIEKPLDYYRSYLRLLKSLHQHEDSKL